MLTLRQIVSCFVVLAGCFAMGNTGCETSKYERKILDQTGDVAITLDELEGDSCSVYLDFERPVWKVVVHNSGSFQKITQCIEKEDCLSSEYVYVGCDENNILLDGDNVNEGEREIVATEKSYYDTVNSSYGQECNAQFTVTVWTADGEKSELRYFQFEDYYDSAWL